MTKTYVICSCLVGDNTILSMLARNPRIIDPYVPLHPADLKLNDLPVEILDTNLDVVKGYFTSKAWSAVKKSGIKGKDQYSFKGTSLENGKALTFQLICCSFRFM